MLSFKYLFIFLWVLCPLLASTNPSYPPNPYDDTSGVSPAVSDARAVAVTWLTLMDQVQYGPAWQEAGPLFRDIITKEQWIAAMEGIRSPLGYVSMRKVEAQRTMNALPYGTLGYFMEIKFTTSFWRKSSAVEICTLMFDQLNNWRVIHYAIE
jgi:hypothetical protein